MVFKRGELVLLILYRTITVFEVLMAKFLPALALIGAIVSLNAGSSYGKHLFQFVGAEGTAAYRVGFSACMLLALWRPWRFVLELKDWRAVILYGLVLGLMNLTFYLSLVYLPLGIAIAIEFSGPLTVAFFESRRRSDFFWIALALLGLAGLLPWHGAMFGASKGISIVGIGYALASAFFWAMYIIAGHRLKNLPAGLSTSIGMTVAALTVVPAGVVCAGAKLLNWGYIGIGLIVALLSSAIPYSLEMFALKRLPKSTFGILCSMEPAVGAIAGMIVLGEALSLAQWLSICCVMAASAGSCGFAANDAKSELDGVVL